MTSCILELYGTASCPFTAEMRSQLEYEERLFVEYDVERDRTARERLVSLTGQHMVPALVRDGRVVAIGCHGRGCLV